LNRVGIYCSYHIQRIRKQHQMVLIHQFGYSIA
jgi:hypothetical protein